MVNLKTCYEMGKDYAKNGADEVNCNHKIFATKEGLEKWERGKKGLPYEEV